jgi:peroxiredoxin
VAPHRVLLVLCMMFLGVACDGTSEDGPSLSEGDRAPAFRLPAAAGEDVALSDFAGAKPTLLYFSMGPG